MPRGYSSEQASQEGAAIQRILHERGLNKPESAEYEEAALDAQAETEKRERPARLERLSQQVERLFPGETLAGLRADIKESFNVPQFGEYHNEGMYMDTHLERILDTIEDVSQDTFPAGIPEETKQLLRETAADQRETLERYTFLHDISKKDTIAVRFLDKSKAALEPSWDEWRAMIPKEAASDPVVLRAWCKAQGIRGISYFHESKNVQHGSAGAELLEALSQTTDIKVAKSVLIAIDKHEVAYLFTKPNAKTFGEHLGGLAPDQRRMAITASYVDQMSSLRRNGQPDTRNIVALADSEHNFDVVSSVEKALLSKPDLEPNKIQNQLARVRNSETRITEDAQSIVARIEKEVRPKQYDQEKLQANLQALATTNQINDEERVAILDAVAAKDLSIISKKFGKRARLIVEALRASEQA
jgi:hypothetical protein